MGRRQVRRTGVIVAAALALIIIAAHDLSDPQDSIPARAAIAAVDQYRAHLSPRISRFVTCRFRPTCSAYGREAIRKYGVIRGGARTVARIAMCGPWTPAGTVDLP